MGIPDGSIAVADMIQLMIEGYKERELRKLRVLSFG